MADTTKEKTIKVAAGLGTALPSQVLAGVSFTSENGFNLTGTVDTYNGEVEVE